MSAKQLAYVCDKVDNLYISKTAMYNLGMISKMLAADPKLAAYNEYICGCPKCGTDFPELL